MNIDWLSIIDQREINEFLKHLHNLANTDLNINKKRRIEHIYIPLVENHGLIADDLAIANLLDNLGGRPGSIPLEIKELYNQFRASQEIINDSTQLQGKIMNTREAAKFTGRNIREIRQLARRGKISEAMKKGQHKNAQWRFLDTALIIWRIHNDLL